MPCGYMGTWQHGKLTGLFVSAYSGLKALMTMTVAENLLRRLLGLSLLGGNNQTFFPLTALVLDTFFLNDYVYIYINTNI